MIFTQSIILEKRISQDVYGSGTYGDPSTVPAAIDYVIKNIKDFKGNTILTSAWIAVPPGTNIDLSDRLTMPDGTNPYIGSVAPTFNYRTGDVHYIEVFVGRVCARRKIIYLPVRG